MDPFQNEQAWPPLPGSPPLRPFPASGSPPTLATLLGPPPGLAHPAQGQQQQQRSPPLQPQAQAQARANASPSGRPLVASAAPFAPRPPLYPTPPPAPAKAPAAPPAGPTPVASAPASASHHQQHQPHQRAQPIYPEPRPEIVLPALVPRLTALLPLNELNIFLQASKRHMASMVLSGSLAALALRHPRDNGNNGKGDPNAKAGGDGAGSSADDGAASTCTPTPTAAAAAAAAGGGGGSATPAAPAAPAIAWPNQYAAAYFAPPDPLAPKPPVVFKVLERYQRGLTTLRISDPRVVRYLLMAAHARLCTRLQTLILRDLNLPDEASKDVARLALLLSGHSSLMASAATPPSPSAKQSSSSPPPASLSFLPALTRLDLGGSNRFGDAGVAALAVYGLGKLGAPRLVALDLGANGLTASGQALEALADAFEARSAALISDGDEEDEEEDEDDGTQGASGKEESKAAWRKRNNLRPPASPTTAGPGVVGLKSLALGQWTWDRPSPSSSVSGGSEESKGSGEDNEDKGATKPAEALALHPLSRLLTTPAVGATLETLDLSRARLLPVEMEAIAAALRLPSSSLRRLKCLKLTLEASPASTNNSQGLLQLFASLRDGGAPRLAQLDIDHGDAHGEPVLRLADALRRGSLRKLASLRLAHAGLDSHDAWRLLEGLASPLPALESGGSTTIKKAPTGTVASHPTATKLIALRSLALDGNPGLGTLGLQALSIFLREGALAQLATLNLNGSKGNDVGLRDLARSLEAAGSPRPIRGLHLNGCDITPQGLAWLGAVMARGSLPLLEELALADNPDIGAEGVAYLATFLREKVSPQGALADPKDSKAKCRLRVLDLRWTEMGKQGAESLAEALEGGACPSIERIYLMQGPRTAWNVETQAAMHKVRDALAARAPSCYSPFAASANLSASASGTASTTVPTSSLNLSSYLARRRAGAGRRAAAAAAAAGHPRVICL